VEDYIFNKTDILKMLVSNALVQCAPEPVPGETMLWQGGAHFQQQGRLGVSVRIPPRPLLEYVIIFLLACRIGRVDSGLRQFLQSRQPLHCLMIFVLHCPDDTRTTRAAGIEPRAGPAVCGWCSRIQQMLCRALLRCIRGPDDPGTLPLQET